MGLILRKNLSKILGSARKIEERNSALSWHLPQFSTKIDDCKWVMFGLLSSSKALWYENLIVSWKGLILNF